MTFGSHIAQTGRGLLTPLVALLQFQKHKQPPKCVEGYPSSQTHRADTRGPAKGLGIWADCLAGYCLFPLPFQLLWTRVLMPVLGVTIIPKTIPQVLQITKLHG